LTNTHHFVRQFNKQDRLRQLFKVISDIEYMPVIILTWADPKNAPFDLKDLSHYFRQHNWTVPAYVLPKSDPDEILDRKESTQVLRIVVQQTITSDKLNNLVNLFDDGVRHLLKEGELPGVRGRGYHC